MWLPWLHTSGSLHLGLRLMCFCARGSSQKRHSVQRNLPGGVCVRVHVCVVVDVRERRGDETGGGGVGVQA